MGNVIDFHFPYPFSTRIFFLFARLEIAMKFTQIGRNRYNGKARVALKQGNMPELEIWVCFSRRRKFKLALNSFQD